MIVARREVKMSEPYVPDWKTYDANQINDLYERIRKAEAEASTMADCTAENVRLSERLAASETYRQRLLVMLTESAGMQDYRGELSREQ
jgi:hypothetical protein